MYAFFYDRISSHKFILATGSQFDTNALFERIIRHQATSTVYPGSVTLESGEDLLLGVPLACPKEEDFDSATDSLLQYKSAVLEQLPEGAGLRYIFQDEALPSFYDGPSLSRNVSEPEPPVIMPKDDDVSIIHLRVWEDAESAVRTGATLLKMPFLGFDPEGLSSRGGATIAFSSRLVCLDTRGGSEGAILQLTAGISICSLSDNFCRRIGANQALARLAEAKVSLAAGAGLRVSLGVYTGPNTGVTVEVLSQDEALLTFRLPVGMVDLRNGGQPRISKDTQYTLAYQTLTGVGKILAEYADAQNVEPVSHRDVRTLHLVSIISVLLCAGDRLNQDIGETEVPTITFTESNLTEFTQDMQVTTEPVVTEVVDALTAFSVPQAPPSHGTIILTL